MSISEIVIGDYFLIDRFQTFDNIKDFRFRFDEAYRVIGVDGFVILLDHRSNNYLRTFNSISGCRYSSSVDAKYHTKHFGVLTFSDLRCKVDLNCPRARAARDFHMRHYGTF